MQLPYVAALFWMYNCDPTIEHYNPNKTPL